MEGDVTMSLYLRPVEPTDLYTVVSLHTFVVIHNIPVAEAQQECVQKFAYIMSNPNCESSRMVCSTTRGCPVGFIIASLLPVDDQGGRAVYIRNTIIDGSEQDYVTVIRMFLARVSTRTVMVNMVPYPVSALYRAEGFVDGVMGDGTPMLIRRQP
jgi:hypothetical protein